MDMKVGRPAEMLEAAAKQGITIAAGCVFPRLGGRVAQVAVLATANKAATAGHLVNVSYFGAQGEVIMASPDPAALREALDLVG